MSDTEQQAILTVDEAAKYLRCSRGKVYELHRDFGLPFVRIGRRNFIRRNKLDAWLDQHDAA